MLTVDPDKDGIPTPVTSRIREVLARNITARNHGLSPLQFSEAVTTLLSSLVASRLLEEAGVFRYGTVKEQTRDKGLVEGFSSLFLEGLPEEPGTFSPVSGVPVNRTWPDVTLFKSLSIDPQVTSTLLALTNRDKFYEEWADVWSESHERSLLAFLRYSARLSLDGRMVITEQYPAHASPGVPLLPAPALQKIASDLLLPGLAGKTPKNAGLQFIDPACRTGRILLAMYRVLADWHLSWYTDNLVTLLEEGRDPASRKVQDLLPDCMSSEIRAGYQRFGTLPLPVYQLPDGRWDLSWDEKVRILRDSLHGVDSDPAAVEVTRLSILSYLLRHMEHGGPDCATSGLLREILSRNIRCNNILVGKDFEKQPTLLPGTGAEQPVKGFFIGDEFPAVASRGGFGVVFSMFPPHLPFSGKDLQYYLCRHYSSGKPNDATPYYLESGLLLTQPGGVLCGIVNGDWQRSHEAALFRRWLAGYQVDSISSLGNLPFFTGMHNPVLITVRNHPPEHPVRTASATGLIKEGAGSITFSSFRSIDPKSLGSSPWMFKGPSPAEVRKKIDTAGTPLGRYILGEYMLGEDDGNQGFVISRQEYEIILRKDQVMGNFIHPFITPGEVRRYCPPGYSRYIVRIPRGTTCALAGDVLDIEEWFCNHHHTIAGILAKNHSKLPGTRTDDQCWWEWAGPATSRLTDTPTLLTRATGTAGGPEWMTASRGVYPGTGVLAIPCNDPALAGILNSRLAKFYIISSARKKGMNGYLLRHLMGFPIPVPETDNGFDNGQFILLSDLVEKRRALGNAWDAADREGRTTVIGERVNRCDEEIDAIVYELSGLSSADIGSIEDWLSHEDESPVI